MAQREVVVPMGRRRACDGNCFERIGRERGPATESILPENGAEGYVQPPDRVGVGGAPPDVSGVVGPRGDW
jgi:hypothetical protein